MSFTQVKTKQKRKDAPKLFTSCIQEQSILGEGFTAAKAQRGFSKTVSLYYPSGKRDPKKRTTDYYRFKARPLRMKLLADSSGKSPAHVSDRAAPPAAAVVWVRAPVMTLVLLALMAVQVSAQATVTKETGVSDDARASGPVQVVPVQSDEVQDLCDAQCTATCLTLGEQVCESICGKADERQSLTAQCSWLLRCEHSGCTGSCSTMPDADRAGRVPETPEVSISRDRWTGNITLSWPNYDLGGQEKVVYLVSQKTGPCEWAKLGWVLGTRYSLTTIPDLCKSPTFRVAAVSRFGSRWFSNQVTAHRLTPGPPTNLDVRPVNKTDHPDRDSFIIFNFKWGPPEDWPLEKVVYRLWNDVSCPNLFDQVYVYTDDMMVIDLSGKQEYLITGRIPLYAIGCNVTFFVGSYLECDGPVNIKDMAVASKNLVLNCESLPNHQKLCKNPPVLTTQNIVRPSSVRNVTLVVMPVGKGQVKARVHWSPPERPGSAGYVAAYYLWWGVIDFQEGLGIAYLKEEYLATVKVGPNVLENEITLNISTFDPFEKLGVVIQAAGPNQTMRDAYSTVYMPVNLQPASYDFDPDDVLVNTSKVYVLQTYGRDPEAENVTVNVFWRRPGLGIGMEVGGYQVTLAPEDADPDIYLLDLLGEGDNSTSNYTSVQRFSVPES